MNNIIYWFILLKRLSTKSLQEDLNNKDTKMKQKLFEWSTYNLILQEDNQGFDLTKMMQIAIERNEL